MAVYLWLHYELGMFWVLRSQADGYAPLEQHQVLLDTMMLMHYGSGVDYAALRRSSKKDEEFHSLTYIKHFLPFVQTRFLLV